MEDQNPDLFSWSFGSDSWRRGGAGEAAAMALPPSQLAGGVGLPSLLCGHWAVHSLHWANRYSSGASVVSPVEFCCRGSQTWCGIPQYGNRFGERAVLASCWGGAGQAPALTGGQSRHGPVPSELHSVVFVGSCGLLPTPNILWFYSLGGAEGKISMQVIPWSLGAC